MIRYWFEFDFTGIKPIPPGLIMGCGLSALDDKDAMELLSQKVFKQAHLPPIKVMNKNINISELDPRHVLPNMGNCVVRGVWFPLGYE